MAGHRKPIAKCVNPAVFCRLHRGGNQLYYTKSEEFHALWDKVLPAGISADVNGLAGKIVDGVTLTQYQTTGDYHHWAETWAGDSMNAANAAYAGITFNSAANVPDPRHAGKTMLNISITLPAGYKAAHQPRAKDQLSQAAVHLAQLLSRIKFN